MDLGWSVLLKDFGLPTLCFIAVITGRLVPWFIVNLQRRLLEQQVAIYKEVASVNEEARKIATAQMAELTKAIRDSIDQQRGEAGR
jgi:hypothetical protein